jgi:lauroyl/myristoyl acyltransferase
LIWLAAFLFLFAAAPARKALLRNLRAVIPGSWRIVNYVRVLRIFSDFDWSLTDAAVYRLKKARFHYELEGGRFLEQPRTARSAIVLTAHMGNYDLGAALLAERFHRQIRIVRTPEPDALAAPACRSCVATIDRGRGQN